MKVILPFAPARGKQPDSRDIDLRNPDDVADLLRYLDLMSDSGLREVLHNIQSLPPYAQAWAGSMKIVHTIWRKLGVIK